MSDTTFGGSFGGGAGSTGSNGADVPPVPGAVGPTSVGGAPLNGQPPSPSPMQQFGSGLNKVFGGPDYKAPDPQTSALDQSASLLQQRIDRASSISSNPVLQFFDPDAAAKARDAVPQMTQQLQQIKTQKQQQTDIQSQALNFGMPADKINPNMTESTVDNYLLDRYKAGDPDAFRALKARGKDEWLQDFAGDAMQAHVNNMASAHTATTALDAAGDNQAAFKAALAGMSPKDHDALDNLMRQEGLQGVPDTAAKWRDLSSKHGAAFAQTRMFFDQKLRQMQAASNFEAPAPKEVGDSIAAGVTLGSTNEPAFDGKSVKSRAQDGQMGVVGPNGSVRTDKFGQSPSQGGWNATTPERIEKNDKMFAGDDVKGAINQYNIANKFRHEATDERTYTSSAGMALLKDTLGGVGRDVAEKSAAAGTTGLSKMFMDTQGTIEGFMNRAQSEYAAWQNWKTKGEKGAEPRVSDQTKKGLQEIARLNYDFAKEQGVGRLSGAMRYAGQIGRPLEDIPLDASLKADVARYHEEGRIDAVNGFNAYPSMVRGNQRVYFQQGSNVSGATGPRDPVPFNPQAQPAATPPSGSGSGTPPAQNPAQPAGGAQPPTIAGQQVNFTPPAGASPAYLGSMQHIETGNEKTPWTATTPGSSASGAFQMIDSTWNANKPAGATATRAKDATPEQQTQAVETFTAKNAAALKGAGIEVNDTNLYVAHNLGGGGAAALLRASPNADARTVVGEQAAKNNSMFFKGRPTVATVLGRYQANMAQDISDSVPRTAPKAAAEAPGLMTRISRMLSQGVQGGDEAKDKAVADVGNAAVNNAPAIASTIGAIGGTAAGGPVGGVAGGAAGGGAGQALKDYLQGNAQSPTEIAKQTALGGVLGVVAEGRPLLSAAARAVGAGGVEAGATKLEGGENSEATAAGLEGAGTALGGEMFGRALGMAGHKVFSMFAPDAKVAVQAAAKSYADATETLRTETPKLPGVGGAAGGANPKYEAAEAAKEKAEATLVDAGLKPEEAAYAHKVSSESVPKQEAEVSRPGAIEKDKIGAGYQQLQDEVGAAGVGAPKGSVTPLQDGPVTAVMDKQVSAKHMELAEHVENAIKAPAANWQEKWTQLKDARSQLLQAERDAMSSTAPGKSKIAADMRTLADTVRVQQAKAAKYVFGEKDGEAFMGRLKVLDTRYRNLMEATNGGDLAQAAAMKGEAGRAADQKFRAFAHDDPAALQAWSAMRGARNNVEKDVLQVISAEKIPLIGKAVSLAKLAGGFKEWMRERTAGSPTTFADYMKANENGTTGQTVRDLAGTAAQRGATMQ